MTAAAIARAFAARIAQSAAPPAVRPTLEDWVTDVQLCGSTKFQISPAQRALVRAVDGLDPLLEPDACRFHFGVHPLVQDEPPRTIVPRTGVRSAKSLLAATDLLRRSLYADMSGLRPGELVRALIVAPKIDLSMATFHHALGTMESSPRLKSVLVKPGAERAVIKRADGREVVIQIVAAARGGAGLRSTWLAGIVFDEADFHDAEDAAVNLAENIRAVEPRMLPGGAIWVPSSPWADSGTFHRLHTDYFGRPRLGVLAFHSDSRSMNPTLDVRDEQRLRASDPDTAAREYDAIPISSSGSEFFPQAAVQAAVNRAREQQLRPEPGVPHWAGVDLGFRRNSSAIALARNVGGRVVLAFYEELRPRPGEPLKPSEVVGAFARTALSYHCTTMRGDRHYVDAAVEELARHRGPHGESVTYDEFDATMEATTEAFTEFRRLMLEGKLELPDDPRLLRQIEQTKSAPVPGGKLKIVLPKIGMAHGDLLMAVVLACVQARTDQGSFATRMQMVRDSYDL